MIQRSAHMNERCATLIARPKQAAGYLLEAERLWRLWGCELRAQQLIAQYPQLFAYATPSSTLHMRRVSMPDLCASPRSQAGQPLPPGSRHGSTLDAGSEFGWDSSAITFAQSFEPPPTTTPTPVNPNPLDLVNTGFDGGAASLFAPPSAATRNSAAQPRPSPNISPAPRHADTASMDSEMLDSSSLGLNGIEKRSTLGVELDMKTILKASLVISEELNIDRCVFIA
jgi:hypothetical protein